MQGEGKGTLDWDVNHKMESPLTIPSSRLQWKGEADPVHLKSPHCSTAEE